MHHAVSYARNYAIQAHGEQKYGKKPYVYHLDHVYQVCCRFGYHDNPVLGMGCFLHDIIEDTLKSVEDVRATLGGSTDSRNYAITVGELVLSVTDFPSGDKTETFTKRTQHNKQGVLLKMFDRIANIEACLAEDKIKVLKKYHSEHHLFVKILKPWEIDQNVWNYLKELNELIVGRIYKDIL